MTLPADTARCLDCGNPTSDGIHTCSPQSLALVKLSEENERLVLERVPGQLPGTQWKPSNSDQGYAFLAYWCSTCTRDKAFREGVEIEECDDSEKCEIIGASFRGEAIQWRTLPDGKTTCLGYVEHGKPVPQERCPNTSDLFGDE